MNKAMMQEIWDVQLLGCWHAHAPVGMVYLRWADQAIGLPPYIKASAESIIHIREQVKSAGLLRVPRAHSYFNLSVRVALAEDMPWLNRQLWAEAKSDDELIAMMTKANYDIEKAETRYRNALPRKSSTRADLASAGADKAYRQKINRGESWSITKPVRSK